MSEGRSRRRTTQDGVGEPLLQACPAALGGAPERTVVEKELAQRSEALAMIQGTQGLGFGAVHGAMIDPETATPDEQRLSACLHLRDRLGRITRTPQPVDREAQLEHAQGRH